SPHQIFAADPGSLTMNLSCGERPVCLPVRTTSGPSAAIRPSPARTASSYSSAVGRLARTIRPIAGAPPTALAVVVGRVVDCVIGSDSCARAIAPDRPAARSSRDPGAGAARGIERGSRLPQSLLAAILPQPGRNLSATRWSWACQSRVRFAAAAGSAGFGDPEHAAGPPVPDQDGGAREIAVRRNRQGNAMFGTAKRVILFAWSGKPFSPPDEPSTVARPLPHVRRGRGHSRGRGSGRRRVRYRPTG